MNRTRCAPKSAAYGFDGYNGDLTGDKAATLGINCGTSTGRNGVIAVATQQGGAEISDNGVCPTVTAAAGMSGNNQPWICTPNVTRCKGLRRSCFGFDVFNMSVTGNVSKCLNAAASDADHVPCVMESKICTTRGNDISAVAYGISSFDSNAMKSSNPHSGIYVANTSRTLDLNGGNPACNQGGIAIVCRKGEE